MNNQNKSKTKLHKSLEPGTETQLFMIEIGDYFTVIEVKFVEPQNALDNNPLLKLIKKSPKSIWTAKNVKTGEILTISKYAHIITKEDPTKKELVMLENLEKGDSFEANEEGEIVKYEVLKPKSGDWGWVTAKVSSSGIEFNLDPRIMVTLLEK